MKKTDRQLGMDCDITRRDFIHDLSLASLGVSLTGLVSAGDPAWAAKATENSVYYPPTRTGIRGSHPGSFEVAHALAREGKQFKPGTDTGEEYDLVVVGGGISGLASAFYYRKLHGADSRILILENHDDFGGHAKRNEFHQGGEMRLSWGGAMNLEYPMLSDTVKELLVDLDIDFDRLLKNLDFSYGYDGKNGPAVWFDRESYGRDHLAVGCSFRDYDLDKLARKSEDFPISEESRGSLKNFALARRDIRAGMSERGIQDLMHQTSYIDFLLKYGGLTTEAAELFVKTTDGYWGVSAHSLSVAECIDAGLPIKHLLGGAHEPGDDPVGGSVAMFPDGNASIARMLVRALIPTVASGKSMDDIVTAKFDYSRLDEADSKVRLRLNSTVVKVLNNGRNNSVSVTYVSDGNALKVRAKHCVLACYHVIIPHLCPQLPETQKEAQRYQVKRPLLLTNVLLRNSRAADKLGISGAYCPGRMHGVTWLCKGVHSADYQHEWSDDGPVAMMFWGMLAASQRGMDIKAQHRDSRAQLLALAFEDYEREVRTVLDGMLGPAGFDVKKDILAITVNRWPHGYAYDYLDLWDPDWPKGEAPHEIARKPFGNIAIANSDAGADAYTHVAIDQAWRAVNDLKT